VGGLSTAQHVPRGSKVQGALTAYLLFDGEQLGLRKAENIARALEAEPLFYVRTPRFEPAALDTRNLPS